MQTKCEVLKQPETSNTIFLFQLQGSPRVTIATGTRISITKLCGHKMTTVSVAAIPAILFATVNWIPWLLCKGTSWWLSTTKANGESWQEFACPSSSARQVVATRWGRVAGEGNFPLQPSLMASALTICRMSEKVAITWLGLGCLATVNGLLSTQIVIMWLWGCWDGWELHRPAITIICSESF